ncbi:hypothetical protein BC628DRAFT_232312 [Trametes gibbosa]|nr:hypothetical protein BC628DRAFT_232312 [Trametes gibbosa]
MQSRYALPTPGEARRDGGRGKGRLGGREEREGTRARHEPRVPFAAPPPLPARARATRMTIGVAEPRTPVADLEPRADVRAYNPGTSTALEPLLLLMMLMHHALSFSQRRCGAWAVLDVHRPPPTVRGGGFFSSSFLFLFGIRNLEPGSGFRGAPTPASRLGLRSTLESGGGEGGGSPPRMILPRGTRDTTYRRCVRQARWPEAFGERRGPAALSRVLPIRLQWVTSDGVIGTHRPSTIARARARGGGVPCGRDQERGRARARAT